MSWLEFLISLADINTAICAILQLILYKSNIFKISWIGQSWVYLGEVERLPGMKHLAQALSLKLHREFPLVDGMVIEK